MKVSSGVWLPLRCVEEEHQRFVWAKLFLHIFDWQRGRARERGIVREIRRKLFVDDRDASIDCGQSGDVL
jgi:hypothetical protein